MSLIGKLLAAIGGPTGEASAEAVDLDGTNDYFSRASDFTGNADGKTFTFSAWVWVADTSSVQILYAATATSDASTGIDIYISGGTGVAVLNIQGQNSGGSTILFTSTAGNLAKNTLNHVLISIDLANSSNRYVYINDVLQSPTWTNYTNDNIDNTRTYHGLGGSGATGNFKLQGRLSNVFLDYTYRDLSVEANRRLFITADRKPTPKATLQALNPIMFFPMDDPTTAHINLGTGGNMTPNGVIARSGRGPNQFNVPYSDLDGSADDMTRTSNLSGAADGKQVTIQASYNADAVNQGELVWHGTTSVGHFRLFITSGNKLQLQAANSGGTLILSAAITANHVVGRNYTATISFDLSDTGKRHVYINGQAPSVTWTTYTDDNIYLTAGRWGIGVINYTSKTSRLDGRLGNVFFHTAYIDLSVPANLAKFVTGTGIDAKPVDLGANGELPLGTTPLIYLPMYGNDAGRDISGNGNHFTVNSGPFVGSRGPNEYWGNKADFDGSTGYLARTSALTGVSDGKTFSCSFWFSPDQTGNQDRLFAINNSGGGANRFIIYLNASNQLQIEGTTSAGTTVLDANTAATFTAGNSYWVQIHIDLANASNRGIYVNGTVSNAFTTYSNNAINLSDVKQSLAYSTAGGNNLDGKLSEFYFTTDYIDFSQEANRLLFRDAFGNPTDLPALIEAGSVPNPAIYMRFDPADQGKNDGTGGNFTKSGTINDGGQL